MKSQLPNLPINRPAWLKVRCRTDESSVLQDADRQLDPLRKLIEPGDTLWVGEQKPAVCITKVHGYKNELTAVVIGLEGDAPPGEIFVRADGTAIRLGRHRSRFLYNKTLIAQRIFRWATHLAAWTWADEISPQHYFETFNRRISSYENLARYN